VILKLEPCLRFIADKLLDVSIPSREYLEKVKREACKKYELQEIPSNSAILEVLSYGEYEKLVPILKRKQTRSASGVNVIAVMTEPRECPHGRCIYCPGGPEIGTPQSYTGREPAAMRGSQNLYDPYKQVKSRINQLRAIGHDVDKVDLIIMGGTFPATSHDYQNWFVKGCLEAICNVRATSLLEAKELSEKAEISNVGITVETRPDNLRKEDINHLLALGVTRVEIGVQNIFDDIYEFIGRNHSIQDVIDSTMLLRDSGLKVCYHMMPGLPRSSPKRDLQGFEELFENSDFRPDMMKIYPTLVIKGTKLYDIWKSGKYSPLSTSDATSLLIKMKKIVPPWVRIMRIQRDIPSQLIEAGVDKSNLRQIVQEKMKELGIHCNCIRCREIGREKINISIDDLRINYQNYEASKGIENFISIEDKKSSVLIGFLRLRLPSENFFRPEIDDKTALIRELHVYGLMVPVGKQIISGWQHRGWGKILISEAERIALEDYDAEKITVMSALGTKRYYEKLGYRR
jgi:elongator complex protein 3